MKKLTFLVLMLLAGLGGFAQSGIIDEVISVVGDNIILRSEIEAEYVQATKQMDDIDESFKCEILNQIIMKKLFLHKAEVDSVEMAPERVDADLDRKIRHYASMVGGEKKLEEYLGMSILAYKDKMRPKIREQMLMQDIQGKILKDVKITPTEVKKYYESIPKDSLPLFGSEVEVAQITRTPKVTKEAKDYALEQINQIKERLLKGEDFCKLARLYSDDYATSGKCGELGFFGRGDMVPEFEAAAFKLRGDTISKVIESQYGFHILKLISRKGEQINVRHILIKPKTVRSDLYQAKAFLDSLLLQISADSVSFCDAAKKHSDDEATRANCGFFMDQASGTTKVPVENLERDIVLAIEKMKPGEYSEPLFFKLPDNDAYRILYLKTETKPHRANLNDDYQKIQQAALEKKQQEILEEWAMNYKKQTFIRINDKFLQCEELKRWNKK